MIGLVVVSHSRRLAEGVAELAGQMAPDVTIVPAGGDGEGGLGTDFMAVTEAIEQASGDGVVVLYDLGSARMVADMAAEEATGEVRVVDAPLVEGAVAAAVAAQGGAALDAVAAAATGAAEEAGWTRSPADTSTSAPAHPADTSTPTPAHPTGTAAPDPAHPAGTSTPAPAHPASTSSTGEVRAQVVLTNDVGLHARPAALVARALAGLDARVVVRFDGQEADAASVLALMGLGAPGGARVELVASGTDAAEAVRRVEDLAARNFDE
ncbi:dihydroxyacetone kinase phosphoryl donor subunit DhaM [Saccharothrix variisporea]|uniref:Phosphocarrier protein HPr n=1 Tax=Saccharothrix variisporea TaxID=543527 RepID=A0A495XFK5_9PSEU|nr:dihydroxyacetone kinase phosphoryl donor subunit DhaM [Saccharothrix variisporea]RKT72777.1 PTS hybrid protein [Saccharothrix variisporea]